jgi:phosphate transport system ATP-binding protein
MVKTMSQPQISFRDVSFTYGDGTPALNNISLDIDSNEIFVVFGPARSGKTTLLRLLNRLSDLNEGGHHQGTVLLDGQDIFARDTDVSTLRRRISMVFAIPTPLPGSIRDNLTYGLRMAGIQDKVILEERVEQSLTQAGLWNEVKDRLDSSAFALSGGQQQRLCLARSLALEPEVIVLDKPTSGLDPLSTGIVEESLQSLKQQYTIVVVPHSPQQGARIADSAAFLLDGSLVEAGSAEQIFDSPGDQRTQDYITGRYG